MEINYLDALQQISTKSILKTEILIYLEHGLHNFVYYLEYNK